MATSVRERVHRILRRRPNFTPIRAGDLAPSYLSSLSLLGSEEVLGIYENVPGSKQDAIVVSTLGLYVLRTTGNDFAPYGQMEAVLTPAPEDKQIVTQVLIRMTSGTLFSVPVTGGPEGRPDAWEWIRFVQHVIDDARAA